MLEILIMLATEASAPAGWWEGLFEHLKITDIIIATFTVVLVSSSIWLGWSARTITRMGQRAYLSIEPLGINTIETSDSGEQTLAYVGIRNTGRLPARGVFLRAQIDAPHDGDKEDFPDQGEEHGSYIVPSGTVMIHGTPARMSATRIDKVQGEGQYCYVWGSVRYNDGFDVSRHTDFCHRYPINMRTQKGKIKKKFARFHTHGNDAD